MDSDIHVKENAVSSPLKHLLSLDWESTRISSKSKDPELDIEQSKPKKKVRFSDEVKEILCGDNASEIYANLSVLEQIKKDENDHTYCAQLRGNISEIPIQNEASTKTSMRNEDNETDYLENRNDIPSEPVNLNDKNTITGILDSEISIIEDGNSLQTEYEGRQYVSQSDISDLATQIKKVSLHLPQFSSFPEKVSSASLNRSPMHQKCIDDDDASSSSAKMKNLPKCDGKRNERMYQKVCNQKQSMELNSVLTKDANVSSASELKTAVFKAWYRVKKKNKAIESPTSKKYNTKPDIGIPTSRKSKDHSASVSKHAYKLWRKSKNKSLKSEHKEQCKSTISFIGFRENNKSDEEEREMAFKLWKKKKDEILKQRRVSENKKEEQHKAILLMNANKKKEEAEAAFSAWEAHKSQMTEIESKKKAWLEHIEKEKHLEESLRDKEALKMYDLWLETKHFSCKTNSLDPVETKPPWIPPGKPPV